MDRRSGVAGGFSLGIVALIGVAGCASNKDSGGNGPQALGRRDADQLNSQHARFEQSKDPELKPETHFAAGQLAESQGDVRQALMQYRAALKGNPRHLPSLYRLGVVHTHLKEYPLAIAAWQDYVRATDEDASAYANLGFCLELAGQGAEAEAAYRKGIERDAKNPACRINYGLMLARGGRVEDAMAQLRAVLTEAQAYYNLGSVYEHQGKKDQAKAAYQRAAEIDPTLTAAKTRLSAL